MPRAALLVLGFVAQLPANAQSNVVTYQYSNARACANLFETMLTPANVNQTQFGKLFSYPVDGYVYGQPLYVAGVSIPGKGLHNAVYVVTEHDGVYAFDADNNSGANAAPLWQVSFLGPGVTTVPNADVNCEQIVPEIGITSTPVIDVASATLYTVAMTKETSNGAASYVHRLHALDLASGAERAGSPVVIQASFPGTGEGGTTLTFAPKNYKQRPGLLLLNGVVYTAWSSHCDIGRYHGWLIGYDAKTLQQVSVYNNTPNGNEGSFWASGAGPAADADGNIYLVAGNGTFDVQNGGPDLGESFIKLGTSGGLAVQDYFTPFNFADLNRLDLDVGSSGVALVSDEAGSAARPHLMVSAGKEGRVYVINRDDLGKWQILSDSQIVASVPNAVGPLFGNPAYFNKSVYFCGAGDNLKAFALSNATLTTTPSSRTSARIGGFGCVPSISANGSANGIVWLLESSATLRAYDASNLANELFDSNQNRARDALGSFVKFSVPTIVNGKVYAGTQNSLVVYGLLSPVAVTNAASGQLNGAAPGGIVSIYGSGLAAAAAAANGFPLPTSLGGVSVRINGVLAPLYYVSSSQINAQVPFETATGPATIAISSNAAPIGFNVQALAPGLFVLPGGRAAVLNQDGSVNGPNQPAASGSEIAAFFTGLGPVDNPVPSGAAAPANPLSRITSSIRATIGNATASVAFAGLAPGFAGLYQVNVIVPTLAPGDYSLQVTVGGLASNAAPVTIH